MPCHSMFRVKLYSTSFHSITPRMFASFKVAAQTDYEARRKALSYYHSTIKNGAPIIGITDLKVTALDPNDKVVY